MSKDNPTAVALNPFSAFRGMMRKPPRKFSTIIESYRIKPDEKGVLRVVKGEVTDIAAVTRSYRSSTGVYNQIKLVDGNKAIVATAASNPFYADVSEMPEQRGDSENFQKAQAATIAKASTAVGVDLSKMTFNDVLKLLNEKAQPKAEQPKAEQPKGDGEK